MKAKYIIAIILVAFLFSQDFVLAQTTTEYSDYRRSLKKNGTAIVESPGGLLSVNSSSLIGREPGPIKYRAVYQFDIPESIIPNGSQITKAIFSVDCIKNNHTTELYAYFYNITYDMIGTDNYDEMFAQMEVVDSDIGQAISNNNQLILNSNDPVNPYPEFKQAIQNSLVNDKFVLGIMWGNDGLTQSKTWYLHNFTMSLYIEFTVPTKNVLVDQKLSNNSSVDSVGLWNLTLNKFDEYSVPKTFTWNVNDSKTLQGSQKVLSSQKYNYWDGYSNVVNHKTFSILPTTAELKSQFNPTNPGITIKNSL
ncbi:MAG: hypothetical protein Q8M94_15520, partial [Ignavibacteria bacterium]|nr:hypothetical protein [Ignavibacteria bacterium]